MPSVAKQNNPEAEAAERDEIEQQAIALGVKPPLLQWLKTCDLTTANAFIDELLKDEPPAPGPPKDGSPLSAVKAAAARMAHVMRASTRTAIAERRRAARDFDASWRPTARAINALDIAGDPVGSRSAPPLNPNWGRTDKPVDNAKRDAALAAWLKDITTAKQGGRRLEMPSWVITEAEKLPPDKLAKLNSDVQKVMGVPVLAAGGLRGRELEELHRAMGGTGNDNRPARREATRLVLSNRTPTQVRADKENQK